MGCRILMSVQRNAATHKKKSRHNALIGVSSPGNHQKVNDLPINQSALRQLISKDSRTSRTRKSSSSTAFRSWRKNYIIRSRQANVRKILIWKTIPFLIQRSKLNLLNKSRDYSKIDPLCRKQPVKKDVSSEKHKKVALKILPVNLSIDDISCRKERSTFMPWWNTTKRHFSLHGPIKVTRYVLIPGLCV